jgi:hypothetical protein
MDDQSTRARRLLTDFTGRFREAVDVRERLDATAAELMAAFDETGVPALLLKGPVLARVLYAPDKPRVYVDVDILVEPAALERARAALRERGASMVGGTLHGEAWMLGETMVDLHWQLPLTDAPPQAAWRALYAAHQVIDLERRRVATLNRPALGLHIAIHAAQHGSGHAAGLRDLEVALERWSADVWRHSAWLAHEIRATEAFAAGLQQVPAGQEVARALGLPELSQLGWLPLQERPRGAYQVRALAKADSAPARVRIVRAALLPPSNWILGEYPWARRWRPLQLGAYAIHMARAPLWAARALRSQYAGTTRASARRGGVRPTL